MALDVRNLTPLLQVYDMPASVRFYQELHAKEAPVREPMVTNYGMKQMYLSDPDGYVLCVQWRANSTRAR